MQAETIEATIQAWTEEPEKALTAPAVTARAEESQAVIQAGPFTWRADLPPALVRCETDGRGLLGMEGAEPDLRNVSLDVTVRSPDGDTGVNKIAEAWQRRCPIYLALVKPTDVAVQFRTG